MATSKKSVPTRLPPNRACGSRRVLSKRHPRERLLGMNVICWAWTATDEILRGMEDFARLLQHLAVQDHILLDRIGFLDVDFPNT